eukprot:gnl/Spiro4/26023_TR12962_c0_g1_i1.p1 gnl/Spiro4/26023_TR12962_c0_g1~~gnl/Spiro4/26023_TR12962_c0_g1_i1.p1  ORF type:complete len:163 (-),score=21.69 gnl/Spiro4/26023_TR12962_c0_g1_i1:80-547(-)
MEDLQKKAVRNFKMISARESLIREIVGAVLALAAFYLVFTRNVADLSIGWWGVMIPAGICLWRTGWQSQCGCIVKSKWNLDGRGPTPVPQEFCEFVSQKKHEFYLNVLTSSVVGVALSLFLLHLRGLGVDGVVIWEVARCLLWCLLGGAALSLAL